LQENSDQKIEIGEDCWDKIKQRSLQLYSKTSKKICAVSLIESKQNDLLPFIHQNLKADNGFDISRYHYQQIYKPSLKCALFNSIAVEYHSPYSYETILEMVKSSPPASKASYFQNWIGAVNFQIFQVFYFDVAYRGQSHLVK